MLHGSIAPKVLRFALPIALTGILQQMFNAADVAVVGQFASKYAMAAVGSSSPIINVCIALFTGLALGSNIVIARFTGQGDREGVRRSVQTTFTLALLCGVLLTVFCELIAGPILRSVHVPDNIFPMALKYLRIYFGGLLFTLLYNFEAAMFRSQGDSRTPLICLVVSGVINVALNLFFVLVLGMDVDGVALATVIATVISSGLMLFFLLRHPGQIRLSLKQLRLDKEILSTIVRIGVPTGIQGMLYSFSNVQIQAAINTLGADVMAGSAAAFNIEIFCFYLVEAFGQACTTFTSQNYGANNPRRCKAIFWNSIGQMIAVALVSSAFVILLDRQLLQIFNTDPDVIAAGVIRLRWVVGFEFLNGAVYVLSAFMRGFGASLVPAVVCVAGICGFRIAWVYMAFPQFRTFDSLMWAYPLSWLLTMAVMTGAWFLLRCRSLSHFFNTVKE